MLVVAGFPFVKETPGETPSISPVVGFAAITGIGIMVNFFSFLTTGAESICASAVMQKKQAASIVKNVSFILEYLLCAG
jgi:hypothetical protein